MSDGSSGLASGRERRELEQPRGPRSSRLDSAKTHHSPQATGDHRAPELAANGGLQIHDQRCGRTEMNLQTETLEILDGGDVADMSHGRDQIEE